MTAMIKRHLPSLAILFLSLQFCQAQVPSGQMTLYFNNANTVVYDLTGTYQLSQEIVGAAGSTVDVTAYGVAIAQDAQGRLQGTGTILVSIGSDFVAADYTASGKISGGGSSVTRATLSLRLKGDDVVAGIQTSFNISIKYSLEVGPGGFTGTAKGSANFARLGDGQINSSVTEVPLPAGVNGSWTAQLDIVPFKRLAGTGVILLSNGRQLQSSLSGSYSSTTGLSKVKLTGTFGSQGNSLNLSFLTGATTPESAKGKIMGQTVQE